jgi:hypothetical protein
MDNRLTSIVIPNTVKKIGYRAFNENPLNSISIGANVELVEIGGMDKVTQKEWKYTAFEGTGFDEAYAANNRQAGTYTKVDEVWQFSPRK